MRYLTILLSILLLTACASGGSYNSTTYVAHVDPGFQERERFNTFVIATTNLGKPSRSYLREHEARVDAMLTEYLEKHGFRILPSTTFQQGFDEGVRKYGEPFDPHTGRINERSLVGALKTAADALREEGKADAIIFTDLIETQVFFSSGINRITRFDGVTRKPSMQGPGEGVPADFNWVQQVDAVSLHVNVFDFDLKRLFTGVGGIEVTEAIDSRGGSPRFKRRRNVLDHGDHIEEGIELAMHPVIPMKGWPGQKN